MRQLASEKGFTLVELLVTTTIIGVLSAVVTVGVSGASGSAQTKANQQVFSSVQGGIDTFAAQNPLSTGVPTSGAAAADSTYFAADGSQSGASVSSSDFLINFASTAGANSAFNTSFRLNNSAATFKCAVATAAASFNLKACKN
jgi:prepilin-type N-terminal cleavage/methylation domain-containing protein